MLNKLLRSHFWWHWQNLSERDPDKTGAAPVEKVPREGRAWLHARAGDRQLAAFEWALARKTNPAVGVKVNDEGGVTLHLGVPGCSLFLTVAMPRLVREWFGDLDDAREIALRIHDDAVWWSLWCDQWGNDHPRPPRWRRGCWRYIDAVAGKPVYSERVLRESSVELPLPEGPYPARAKLVERTWTRPRWPFPQRWISCDIDAPGGVPSDHKGPTFGISGPARSIAEGVGKFVGSILRSRAPNHPHQWKRIGELEYAACIKRATERMEGKEHANA